jgi:hypothetical protein
MTQILDTPDLVHYSTEKFIQLYVDKSSEPPAPPIQAPPAPAEEESCLKLSESRPAGNFHLFEQKYKMRFAQKGNIYQRLDQRLQKRKAAGQTAGCPNLS